MRCFFCTSPYQILACASIVMRDKEPGDLYILNQFKDSDRISKKLDKKKDLFSNVKFLDEKTVIKTLKIGGSPLSVHLKLLKLYAEADKIVPMICEDPEKYTDIYVSSKAIVSRIFSLYCKKKYKSNIHYFDDGIGSYNNNAYKTNTLEKIVRLFFFGIRSLNPEASKELYLPQLYCELHKNNNENIVKIPNASVKIISDLYDINFVKPIQDRVVYFDTVYGEEYGSNVDSYKSIINSIFEGVEAKLIVKPHPREINRLFKYKYYQGKPYPFECNCAIQNMENKILISTFSTSCIVPKMLFDQEPTVIFLYKILNPERINNSSVDGALCNAFRNTYRDKEKVIIPENINELKIILKRLME